MPMFTHEQAVQPATSGCPVHSGGHIQQKTAPYPEPLNREPIEQDAYGIWHIRGYAEARQILRSEHTRQAGFKAELLEKMPSTMSPPILYLEGKPHHEQRRATARFFTPRTTDSQYQDFMSAFADELIAEFVRNGRTDLSEMAMTMAVQVAARVVGLTNSTLPGMDKRIDKFLQQDPGDFGWTFRQIKQFLRNQIDLGLFYWLDVKPAIRERRQNPQEDVISHLIAQNYQDMEILTEAVTYGAAGMITTREFISVAFWHCMEQPEYRQLMLTTEKETRYRFLHELLRLEPVVGRLYRRATADIHLPEHNITIPKGALIDLHVYAANADTRVVKHDPLQLCPGRELAEMQPKAQPFMLSFGDGSHRCPGAYIAIQETDIFLRKLLAVETIAIEKEPTITYSEVAKGYELRQFIITA